MTSKFAITNVRIFNDKEITPATTVLIEEGIITSIFNESNIGEADVVNGQNLTLLPGLIDAHVHLHSDSSLHQLAQYGVTTALDMTTWPASLVESLRATVERGGLADFKTAGLPACAPGSLHARMPGMPEGAMVASAEDASAFVEARIEEGVDYVKVIADLPGFEQKVLDALVVRFLAPNQVDRAKANVLRRKRTNVTRK